MFERIAAMLFARLRISRRPLRFATLLRYHIPTESEIYERALRVQHILLRAAVLSLTLRY